MTSTLVDTNIVFDVNGDESAWKPWSEEKIAEAGDTGGLIVNQIIYGELAAGYARREELDLILHRSGMRCENIPWDAAYMAGKAFLAYRRQGGTRTMPLPDFFIGAHAAVRGYRLLTRDRGYYHTYFPTLAIISPDTAP